jgi:hypothetical protein
MRLERRHGWWLMALAAWNAVIWVTFAKNLAAAHAAGEDRPTGYWVAHTVLIVVDLAIAVALAWWSVRILRHRGAAESAQVDNQESPSRR